MKATIEAINKMVSAGVIGQYAIGGAIGASFYLEPAATYDIDVFITLEAKPGSAFVILTPIYDYLRSLGYEAQGEHIRIKDWNVQFLPVTDPLSEEGLKEAVETEIYGERTRIMSAEHLMAMALKTGRSKDFIRLDQFLNARVYDEARFKAILDRHHLREPWEKFKHRFMEGSK